MARKIVHPLYNADRIDYDLALLQLGQPAPVSRWIQPVCLPSRRSYVGMTGTALGWGVDKIDEAAIQLHEEVSI